MNDSQCNEPRQERAKYSGRKVQRHSPDRLLRRPIQLAGGVTVSAEKHNGRILVRVEMPRPDR
jgi:hypothetical protein